MIYCNSDNVKVLFEVYSKEYFSNHVTCIKYTVRENVISPKNE